MSESKNYFEILNSIDVSEKVEKKNGLSYLSWPYAWGEIKKRYPDANFTIYENAQGFNYHTDGRTCWVKTGITVNGIEHIEYLPVMDHRNNSIPLERVTSFDVNKAIQRSLTKAAARHGLGLYIYAGEDMPEAVPDAPTAAPTASAKKTTPKATAKRTEAKPEAQAAAPAPANDPRLELREFIRANHLDGYKIANECGLNPKSTPEDYQMALVYARSMIGG